jgi:hypothetical protein
MLTGDGGLDTFAEIPYIVLLRCVSGFIFGEKEHPDALNSLFTS